MNNRKHNATNECQGSAIRALTVCSAGLLRSPTLAWILSNPPFNFNTRAAGSTKTFALVHADDVMLHWADVVIFVNEENFLETQYNFQEELDKFDEKNIIVLDLPDIYTFKHPELVRIAIDQVTEALIEAGVV